jgi:LPS sulfotransferase NodH
VLPPLEKLQIKGFFAYLNQFCSQGIACGIADPELCDFFSNALPKICFYTDSRKCDPLSTLILDARLHPEMGSYLEPSKMPVVVPLFTDALAAYITNSPRLMPPSRLLRHKYYILSTPRSGSTFLSDLLTSTNCLGAPTEHLKPWLNDLLIATNQTLAPLLSAASRYSATANGVFGSKLIIDDMFYFLSKFGEEIRSELSQSTVFMLMRGDKSQQAISNLRANQLSIYHVYRDDPNAEQLLHLPFEPDLDEVFRMERWLYRQEADLLERLELWGIRPKIIAFETLAQSRHAAHAVINEIADTIGVAVDNGFSWPKLLRIGTSMPPVALNSYIAFRSRASLYSARTEPWLGDILLEGWRPPERWGVRSSGTQAKIAILHNGPVSFIELLFHCSNGALRSLTVDGVALDFSVGERSANRWRWLLRVEQVRDSGVVCLKFEGGDIELEEVVFYSELPSAIMNCLGESRAILLPI